MNQYIYFIFSPIIICWGTLFISYCLLAVFKRPVGNFHKVLLPLAAMGCIPAMFIFYGAIQVITKKSNYSWDYYQRHSMVNPDGKFIILFFLFLLLVCLYRFYKIHYKTFWDINPNAEGMQLDGGRFSVLLVNTFPSITKKRLEIQLLLGCCAEFGVFFIAAVFLAFFFKAYIIAGMLVFTAFFAYVNFIVLNLIVPKLNLIGYFSKAVTEAIYNNLQNEIIKKANKDKETASFIEDEDSNFYYEERPNSGTTARKKEKFYRVV